MNSWYEGFTILFVLAVLFIWFIVCLARLILKKKRAGVVLLINIICTVLVVLFVASHSISFEFNNWAILNHHISDVEEKYGPFDVGNVEAGKAGRVGYYLYTDNGPIMPDHMPHYYFMEYDESGMVYDVYESLPQGG